MNVMNKPARPAPPMPIARKDSPVNRSFEIKAKKLLRDAMDKNGVTVEELTKRLSGLGIDMSAGALPTR